MPEPAHDPFNVYTALGAGHMPDAAAAVAPATPTEAMVIDGINLALASRLLVLARIRDQHRSVSRAANDRMHNAREQIEDREVRIRRLRQADNGRGSATAMTQIGQLQAEIDQFASARATAQAEAEAAGENWRDAEVILKSAIRFARDSGMTIPATLASEGK